MYNPYQLNKKKVLITGASVGIGRSIAIYVSKQTASAVLTARNKVLLHETLGLLEEGEHSILQADLSSEEDIHLLVDALPVLDGVVLNAGMIKTVPVQFIKKPLLDEMFQVNFNASVLIIQQLLKKKKINSGASICFISSLASQNMHIGNAVYSATKGAVNSFAKSLALELAPKNIRVNAILPGMIETNLMDNGAVSDEQLALHKMNYPLGRFGKPEDVAHLVVYLLSDASSWMTGSLIVLDGGYSLK